jgi:SNF2 family DNA or RNA helicase
MDKTEDLFRSVLTKAHLEYKDYQMEGVQWIISREKETKETKETKEEIGFARGGIIADEMGLGKTIMMVGAMVCHFVRRTLIVVPPILIDQWVMQIYRMTGHRALVYHATAKKRIGVEELNKAIVVITTYGEITSRDSISNIHQISWDRLVFDEAHHLRNSNTKRNAGACMLKARFRWLISGTPIQNRKRDFYSLCEVIRLPPKLYKKDGDCHSFVMKRTKKAVGIEMAPVVIDKNMVEWKNKREMFLAAKLHDELSFMKGPRDEKRNEKRDEKRNEKRDEKRHGLQHNGSGGELLPMLLRARQMCIYPRLMARSLKSPHPIVKSLKEMDSKMESLIGKIVERKGNGCGKLVFCHFRAEMVEIARRLRATGFSSVAMIDGSTNTKKRSEMLSSCKIEVLILQIQTGCEGLNLQENYSEIYFVSPHWNPAIEDQAIARCHRIGQKKTVYVEHFAMSGFLHKQDISVENYVGGVQDVKRAIVNKYMGV